MKRTALERSLEFWDFANHSKFTGRYIDTIVINDEETDKEKQITAHIFSEMETSEEFYISDSYLITRSVRKMINAGHKNGILEINFKGKDEVKGKPFNRFEIYLIEDDIPVNKKSNK